MTPKHYSPTPDLAGGSAPVEKIKFDTSFKFGDIVENYWASERNPIRKGIVVKVNSKSLYCTDGKGKFWNLVKDKESKTKVIGSILQPSAPADSQGDKGIKDKVEIEADDAGEKYSEKLYKEYAGKGTPDGDIAVIQKKKDSAFDFSEGFISGAEFALSLQGTQEQPVDADAIEFCDWVRERCEEGNEDGRWVFWDSGSGQTVSTKELYNLFKSKGGSND